MPRTPTSATSWGTGPRPRSGTVFRILNVDLHLVNTALVMVLARRLGASAMGGAPLVLCFTLHPAVPDAVGWSSDVYDQAATTATLGVLGVALGKGHTPRAVMRVHDLAHDGTLWSAELQVEPDNPYAAGGHARWILKEGRDREALALWAGAVDAAPRGLRVFDRDNERWLLAQAAFVRGAPRRGHQQVSILIEELEARGQTPPDQAWCLMADSLDALGRPDEARSAASLCRP